MIEFLSSLFGAGLILSAGVYLGWNYRDQDKQRDAEINARAIIRQSLAEDPKSFMRVLKRVK